MSDINTALVTTDRVCGVVESLAEMNLVEQEHWLAEASSALQSWGKAQDYTVMMEARVLYIVQSSWEHLRKEVTSPWGYEFMKWAKTYTKRGARTPASSTIYNKILVYKDWVAEKNIACPETVFVPKRDSFGELVGPDLIEEEDWEEIPFDPMECDYGKLLVARGCAREGNMNDHAWTALRDEWATVEDLNSSLYEGRVNSKRNGDSFRIYQEGNIVYAEEDEITCAVLEIIPDSFKQAVGCKAVARVKKVLGLPAGEERIEPVKLTNYDLATVENERLILCINGITFASFDWQEACQIKEAIERLEEQLEHSGKAISVL
jgi:hypothetical protein